MNWQETKDFLSPCFPEEVRDELALLYPGELREIRVRAHQQAMLITSARTAALKWRPCKTEVEQLAEALSGHGLYAREWEARQGFITLRGGHRLGMCGCVQMDRHGLRGIRDITFLCLRIAAQWPGAANALMPWVLQNKQVHSTLMIGLPGTGKTTQLRDLARQLGTSKLSLNVCMADERNELAACVDGIPQLDVGACTDVLQGCPKVEAVGWFLRAMRPQVLITDEIASAEDASAVLDAVYAGVPVLASAHGSGLHALAQRPMLASLMARRCFDFYAVLDAEGSGQVTALYDRTGAPIPWS